MRRNVCQTKTKILVALLQAWIMLTQGNKPMKITLRLQFTYLSLVSRDASPGEKKRLVIIIRISVCGSFFF